MSRLFRVEAIVQRLSGLTPRGERSRDDFAFAVPTTRISKASVPSGSIVTPSSGDATFFRYYTDSPSIRFDKIGADRGKMKLHNMHPGMWLWDNVVYPCHRDYHSGLWFAVVDQSPTFMGKPAATIAAGASGTINVYRNESLVSGLTVANVRHTWMAGSTSVTSSTEVLCKWQPESSAWYIVEANC